MFGSKKGTLKEGSFVFTAKPDGDYCNFVIGTVTGVDGNKAVSYTHLTLPTILLV